MNALPLLVLLATSGADSERVGDAPHGARAFALHCASCHGANGRGGGPLAPRMPVPPGDLRSASFLMARGENQLYAAIMDGGPAVKASYAMPAFANTLSTLDGWDLVAFLEQGQLSVIDFFPEAARYTVKAFRVDDDGVSRSAEALGERLAEGERELTVLAAFGGERKGSSPSFVPQDPVALADLHPKDKLGYLAFFEGTLPGFKGSVSYAIAMGKDGVVTRVASTGPAGERAAFDKALAGFKGQGGKKSPERPRYKPLKASGGASPALAKAFTRSYYRALEAAIMFDKDERERTWADPAK